MYQSDARPPSTEADIGEQGRWVARTGTYGGCLGGGVGDTWEVMGSWGGVLGCWRGAGMLKKFWDAGEECQGAGMLRKFWDPGEELEQCWDSWGYAGMLGKLWYPGKYWWDAEEVLGSQKGAGVKLGCVGE